MRMTFNDIFRAAGNIVVLVVAAGGSGAAVAYTLFKWLGQNWIEQRFKAQIERLKHEQNKEIESLRHRIQSLFSRISKIHEKEFEVLPKAWFLLHNAHGKAAFLMAALKYRPDFGQMSEPSFEDFVKHCRLKDYEREELRNASDRAAYYREAVFWVELDDVESSQTTFHNYLIENRIFMTAELREKFSAVDAVLSEALVEHRTAHETRDFQSLRSSVEKVVQLSEKIAQVEEAVQKRLRYEEA